MNKILFFDSNYTSVVNREAMLIRITYWQEAGIAVSIVTNQEGEIFYKKHLRKITYISIPFTHKIASVKDVIPSILLSQIYALRYVFSVRNKYDIIYSPSSYIDFIIFPFFLTFFDKKIMWFVMVDNLVPPPSERPGSFVKKFIPYVTFLVGNMLLKRANGLFVVTDRIKRYYQSKNYTVYKIGNGYGVDIRFFSGVMSHHTKKFDALYIGRIHPAKGVFDLIEVIKNVVKVRPSFTLGIMGDGDFVTKKILTDKINHYQLEKNIQLVGYKKGKEKIDMLRASKCFLFLSYDEGCPQVVIEAFAAQKQVIAYDLPTYHDVFKQFIKKKQLQLFQLRSFSRIANFLIVNSSKATSFQNALHEFSWDGILQTELKVLTKNV